MISGMQTVESAIGACGGCMRLLDETFDLRQVEAV